MWAGAGEKKRKVWAAGKKEGEGGWAGGLGWERVWFLFFFFLFSFLFKSFLTQISYTFLIQTFTNFHKPFHKYF
jgi:hypothetical protein